MENTVSEEMTVRYDFKSIHQKFFVLRYILNSNNISVIIVQVFAQKAKIRTWRMT